MLEIRIGYSLGGYRNNVYFFSSCLPMSRAYICMTKKYLHHRFVFRFPFQLTIFVLALMQSIYHYDIMLCMKCSVGNFEIFFKNLKNISMLSKSYIAIWTTAASTTEQWPDQTRMGVDMRVGSHAILVSCTCTRLLYQSRHNRAFFWREKIVKIPVSLFKLASLKTKKLTSVFWQCFHFNGINELSQGKF